MNDNVYKIDFKSCCRSYTNRDSFLEILSLNREFVLFHSFMVKSEEVFKSLSTGNQNREGAFLYA